MVGSYDNKMICIFNIRLLREGAGYGILYLVRKKAYINIYNREMRMMKIYMGRIGQIIRIIKIRVCLEGQKIIMIIQVSMVKQIRDANFLNRNSKC